jgi:hypothetical protein
MLVWSKTAPVVRRAFLLWAIKAGERKGNFKNV